MKISCADIIKKLSIRKNVQSLFRHLANVRILAKIGKSSYNKNGNKATINRPVDHRLL